MNRRSFLQTSFGALAALSLVRANPLAPLVQRPSPLSPGGIVVGLFDVWLNEVCALGYSRVQTNRLDWDWGTESDQWFKRDRVWNRTTIQFGPTTSYWSRIAAVRLYKSDWEYMTIPFPDEADVPAGVIVQFNPGDIELCKSQHAIRR